MLCVCKQVCLHMLKLASNQGDYSPGISCQNSSLICQILSNPPKITHLNEACLTIIVDMMSKDKISIKPDNKVILQQLLDAWNYQIF